MTFQNEVAFRMQQRRQRLLGQELGDEVGVLIAVGVGRIGKDDVELLAVSGQQGQQAEDIAMAHAGTGEAGFGDVFADDLARAFVFIHQYGGGRATAQALQPQRAGAGKEVQHMGSRHQLAEHGKHSLPHPVLRGTGDGFRDVQREAARGAGDDSHVGSLARQSTGGKGQGARGK